MAAPLFSACWSDAIKAHTIPLRECRAFQEGKLSRHPALTGIKRRLIICYHRTACIILSDVHVHMRRQSPLCQRDGLLIKSDGSIFHGGGSVRDRNTRKKTQFSET